MFNVQTSRDGARWNPAIASVTVWLNRIAHNVTAGFLRLKKGKELRGVDLSTFDDDGQEAWFESQLPDRKTPQSREIVAALDDQERAQALLARLPVQHRTILEMVFRDEKTYKEVAHALGISQPTVFRRIRAVKNLLRSVTGNQQFQTAA
jgi:RNA polymerase sigma factor (sigma-70 family)